VSCPQEPATRSHPVLIRGGLVSWIDKYDYPNWASSLIVWVCKVTRCILFFLYWVANTQRSPWTKWVVSTRGPTNHVWAKKLSRTVADLQAGNRVIADPPLHTVTLTARTCCDWDGAVHTSVHTRTYMHTHTHSHTHTHIHIHIHTHTHTHTHTRIHKQTNTRAHIHTRARVHRHIDTPYVMHKPLHIPRILRESARENIYLHEREHVSTPSSRTNTPDPSLMYSLWHLECHSISISSPRFHFISLFSTKRGQRDPEN